MKFAGYDVHPAANLFPMMVESDFSELKADIEKSGQVQKIVLLDGKILDGRNRALACHELGISPRVIDWDGSGSPIDWVLSVNLKRRHLTASQRAAVAADSLPLYEAEARERQLSTLKQNSDSVTAKIPERGEAREKAAKSAGVSPRYVSDAKAIKEKSPEVFEKVKSGETTLAQAKRAIDEPRPQPADHHPDDEDSDSLWNLKRYWRKATKKEKAAFLAWIKRG